MRVNISLVGGRISVWRFSILKKMDYCQVYRRLYIGICQSKILMWDILGNINPFEMVKYIKQNIISVQKEKD